METEKLIIRNQSDLSMAEVLVLAQSVVSDGRVSGDSKSYCYITSFVYGKFRGITCYAQRNKNSDTLTFWREEKAEV